jgi:hypothetical protein
LISRIGAKAPIWRRIGVPITRTSALPWRSSHGEFMTAPASPAGRFSSAHRPATRPPVEWAEITTSVWPSRSVIRRQLSSSSES